MKAKWMIVGALFASGSAFAYPSAGDRVEYLGTLTQADGTTVALRVSKEVLRFDTENNEWIVRKEVERNGVKSVTEEGEDDLFSAERFGDLSANCVSRGGALEELSVPAGKFATCRMAETDDDGQETNWYGDVPFGIVKKIEVEDGATKSLELNSVKLGE